MSNNTPSSSSQHTTGSGPFHSYPQKFPKAQQAAKRAVGHMVSLMQKGPRSQVALVVDTSFHTSQGYVLCTTNHALARVYGIPFGSITPSMRVFVRQIGSHVTNQAYIFDGFAPNLSTLGSLGSVLYAQTPALALTNGVCSTAFSGMQTPFGVAGAIGYYWHLFFYLPQLPTSTVTLFQMVAASGGTMLNLDYLPTGQLSFHSLDGHGYLTNAPISPHNVHWLLIQPGNTGNELLVDGVADYSGLLSVGDQPVFTGNSLNYTGIWLSTGNGSQLCPLGTWISKMGFGVSYQGGGIVLLPLGTNIPQSDDDIPVFDTSSSTRSLNTYLCEDTITTVPGTQQLSNGSAAWGSSNPSSIISLTAQAQLQLPGPY